MLMPFGFNLGIQGPLLHLIGVGTTVLLSCANFPTRLIVVLCSIGRWSDPHRLRGVGEIAASDRPLLALLIHCSVCAHWIRAWCVDMVRFDSLVGRRLLV